jgi:hypothetical protein
MRARIPAGIDLEDRLLYGLSPARLGYVAGLAVLASWCWRQSPWGPLRFAAAIVLLGGALAMGWLRHDGRHLDAWAEDLVRHVTARYRLVIDWRAIARPLPWIGRRPRDRPAK